MHITYTLVHSQVCTGHVGTHIPTYIFMWICTGTSKPVGSKMPSA